MKDQSIEITNVCLKKVEGFAEVWITLPGELDVLIIKEHCNSNFYNSITAYGIITVYNKPKITVQGYEDKKFLIMDEDLIFEQDIHEEAE